MKKETTEEETTEEITEKDITEKYITGKDVTEKKLAGNVNQTYGKASRRMLLGSFLIFLPFFLWCFIPTLQAALDKTASGQTSSIVLPLLTFTIISWIGLFLLARPTFHLPRCPQVLYSQVELILIALSCSVISCYMGKGSLFLMDGRLFFNTFLPALIVAELVFLISARLWLTADIVIGVWSAFEIAEYYVYTIRGSSFMPWDLLALGTAKEISGDFAATPSPDFLIMYILLVGCHLMGNILRQKEIKRSKSNFFLPLAFSLLLFALYTLLIYPNIKVTRWNTKLTYNRYGAPVAFAKFSEDMIYRKPTGYSTAKAEKILEETKTVTADPNAVTAQNIIVIMDESMADFSVIGQGNDTEELAFYHALGSEDDAEKTDSESVIKGHLYVNVFGGGTCNTEFEVLTGASTKYIGGYPYQYFFHSKVSSLATSFSALDYYTQAMHPAESTNWNRNSVYPFLGFQRMDFYNEIQASGLTKKSDYLRNWYYYDLLSDSGDFKYLEQMVSQSEKKSGGKTFTFNVTMQNHMPYNDMDYFTLLTYTDEGIEQIINYYRNVDTPTLICIFGDHQPKIEKSYYDDFYGKDSTKLTAEEEEEKYITPLLIWTNYEINASTLTELNISANYLGAYIMKYANVDLDSYNSYLYDLSQKWPVVSTYGFLDAAGNYYEGDSGVDQSGELLDYQYLQYYRLR